MGASPSQPLEERQEESLRAAAIAEQARMDRLTLANERKAGDEARLRSMLVEPWSDAVTHLPITAYELQGGASQIYGDPLLDDPPGAPKCSQRAGNHILSAIFRGQVHLLTPRIFEALGFDGVRTRITVDDVGLYHLGEHCTFTTASTLPHAKRVGTLAGIVAAAAILGPVFAVPMLSYRVLEPVVSETDSKKVRDDALRRYYGFDSRDVLNDGGKAWWNVVESDSLLELAMKPIFSVWYSEKVVARQIERVLQALLLLEDPLLDDASKAAWLCRSIVRTRRAVDGGAGADATKNLVRYEAALAALHNLCIHAWDMSTWAELKVHPFGGVCRSLAALPKTPGHYKDPLRAALLEEMELCVQHEEQGEDLRNCRLR